MGVISILNTIRIIVVDYFGNASEKTTSFSVSGL
jgi:hypothetical protein